MSVPRFLLVVPLLAAGVLLPTVHRDPRPAPTGTIGMAHESFDVSSAGPMRAGGPAAVTISKGSTLTFVNDSRWLHVIGPGEDGRINSEPGSASLGPRGAFLSESGQRFTTARWNTSGTFHVTCSLHPEMTVTVTVTDS